MKPQLPAEPKVNQSTLSGTFAKQNPAQQKRVRLEDLKLRVSDLAGNNMEETIQVLRRWLKET